MREKHFVYVIELDKDVLYESKFKKTNPDYQAGKPCVYIGMTGHDPDIRFDQHKAGIKANKYAKKYGLRLMPEIYEKLNPMPSSDAQYMEVDLAIRLQKLGYGVWQN
jgi:predicted GIY-YIG superfamily endonuclease